MPRVVHHEIPATQPATMLASVALAALAALAMPGCAATSNVVPIGPDTYRMTSHQNRGEYTGGWASAGEQKMKIYTDAMAYCQRQGRAATLVAERQVDIGWGKLASVEVDFSCVVR